MEKMKKIIYFAGAFIITVNLILQMPLNVYASNNFSEENEEALDEGLDLAVGIVNEFWMSIPKIENAMRLMFGQIGLFLNHDKWSEGRLYEMYCEYLVEKALIENSDSYDDYLKSHIDISADEEDITEIKADSEIMNTLYEFSIDYIENECGWYECQTTDYRSVPANSFPTQGAYQSFIGYCTQNIKGTDNTVFLYGISQYYVDDILVGKTDVSKAYENIEYYVRTGYFSETGNTKQAYITQNWLTLTPERVYVLEDGSLDVNSNSSANTCNFNGNVPCPLTDGVRTVRIYKTLEDLKNYSVGQRPYYVTDKFLNYDISGDNSCILSESDLSNGSVYGDVYNYIMDNYDNPNNLTEDQLTIIVENYINGSGGGSVSGNGTGSSGNGLSDFLNGLGSIGDAILSILGKLLEYVGKALDLVSGTVTKVLDIVPKNITALLSALFPFFPDEWLLAIELGLVLSVIVGIVGIFKK